MPPMPALAAECNVAGPAPTPPTRADSPDSVDLLNADDTLTYNSLAAAVTASAAEHEARGRTDAIAATIRHNYDELSESADSNATIGDSDDIVTADDIAGAPGDTGNDFSDADYESAGDTYEGTAYYEDDTYDAAKDDDSGHATGTLNDGTPATD